MGGEPVGEFHLQPVALLGRSRYDVCTAVIGVVQPTEISRAEYDVGDLPVGHGAQHCVEHLRAVAHATDANVRRLLPVIRVVDRPPTPPIWTADDISRFVRETRCDDVAPVRQLEGIQDGMIPPQDLRRLGISFRVSLRSRQAVESDPTVRMVVTEEVADGWNPPGFVPQQAQLLRVGHSQAMVTASRLRECSAMHPERASSPGASERSSRPTLVACEPLQPDAGEVIEGCCDWVGCAIDPLSFVAAAIPAPTRMQTARPRSAARTATRGTAARRLGWRRVETTIAVM